MKPKQIKRFFLLLVVIFLHSGCSQKVGYFVTSIVDPMHVHHATMRDGYKSIYYAFSIEEEKQTDTFLFFVGGSGCQSHQYYLRQYFTGFSGNTKIFALQKRYVENHTTGLFGCSDQFKNTDYYSQWVSDQIDFLDHVLKRNKQPQKIVFMGVSEGANVAAAIAFQHIKVTHLIMLASGGGLKQADELLTLSEYQNIDFAKAYKKILDSPDSLVNTFLGQTYKYWSSVLWVDPLTYLLPSEKPILVAMGEKDKMAPVESAYKLQKEFKKVGKDNLTLILYENSNHSFQNSGGNSYLPDLMQRISTWILNNRTKVST